MFYKCKRLYIFPCREQRPKATDSVYGETPMMSVSRWRVDNM